MLQWILVRKKSKRFFKKSKTPNDLATASLHSLTHLTLQPHSSQPWSPTLRRLYLLLPLPMMLFLGSSQGKFPSFTSLRTSSDGGTCHG